MTYCNVARGLDYALAAPGTCAGLLGEKMLVNDGGGGQAIQPSLASLLRFEIQAVALSA